VTAVSSVANSLATVRGGGGADLRLHGLEPAVGTFQAQCYGR